LAELVKSGRPSLRASEWKRVYRQRQNDAASREDLRHLKETIEQAEEDDERTTQARSQLGSALSSLTKLADPRVVRFVAPLLAESAAPFIVGREVSPPAQERAAFILWDMSVQGLIEFGDPRRPFNLEETRVWWQEEPHHIRKRAAAAPPDRSHQAGSLSHFGYCLNASTASHFRNDARRRAGGRSHA
jgi:hypothetical protein